MEQSDTHSTRHLKLSDVDAYYSVKTQELTSLPFCLISIGKQANETLIDRPACLSDHLLMLTLSGSGSVILNNTEHHVLPGSMIYFAPHTSQYYFATKSPWVIRWIVFNGSCVKNLLGLSSGVYGYGNPEEFIHIFDRLFGLPKDVFWANNSSILLYELLLHCKNNIPSNGLPVPQHTKMKLSAVIDYLNENFYRELSLEALAALINVTPTHLCRLFKNAYSLRSFEYINILRIHRAKELIINQPQKTISDISAEVGYNNVSYFLSNFKKIEGITPGEFRSGKLP